MEAFFDQGFFIELVIFVGFFFYYKLFFIRVKVSEEGEIVFLYGKLVFGFKRQLFFAGVWEIVG